jgi:oligoendopeptidase F
MTEVTPAAAAGAAIAGPTPTTAAPPGHAVGVRWDLSDLYAGAGDPQLAQTLERARIDAERFAARYRGKIDVPQGPEPSLLLGALQEIEDLHERIGRVAAYAHLLYDTDTRDETARDLQQKIEQRTTELRNVTLFFDLEWLELPDAVAQRLIADPQLAAYAHYLSQERTFRPHRLTESEEKVINEKDVTGRRAWARLHTEVTSALTFPLERDRQAGQETRQLTLSEVLALAHDPDRDVRRAAHDSLYGVLAGQGQVLTYLYDTLIQDHQTMDRLRGYAGPMHSRHLGNEVEPEAVEAMLQATEANYGLAQEYFTLKARLLVLVRLMV